MDILGIGPLELVLILLVVFLVLGPDDLVSTARKMGKFINTVRKSDFWRGVTQVSKEVRDLPNTLMREADLEDTKKELEELKGITKESVAIDTKSIEKEMKVDLDDPKDEPSIAPPSLEPKSEEAEDDVIASADFDLTEEKEE